MTKPVTAFTTFGANTTGTTTQLDNNFLTLKGAVNDFGTYSNYLVDSGAADAYVVTLGANLTGTLAAGLLLQIKATNANTGASTLVFNGAAAKNILTIRGAALSAGQIPANGIVEVIYDGTQFLLLSAVPSLTSITNSIAGNVALNNTGNYFTGPTVAQGTAGTWFASGTVTLVDTAGNGNYDCKLWDGTTVIDSARGNSSGGAGSRTTVSLSGVLASPAGNIRISVRDITSTSGTMEANATGEGKDSTVTAIRIA